MFTSPPRDYLTPFSMPLTPMIGRERAGAHGRALWLREDVRVVMLTGPGRAEDQLAIAVAAGGASADGIAGPRIAVEYGGD